MVQHRGLPAPDMVAPLVEKISETINAKIISVADEYPGTTKNALLAAVCAALADQLARWTCVAADVKLDSKTTGLMVKAAFHSQKVVLTKIVEERYASKVAALED